MSLMEIAQLLGNLGEFIGAIVIVITLIYLTTQVKQNTYALHAQSRQAVVSSAQAELFAMMDNPDLVINLLKTESLTPEEHVKLSSWMGAVMRLREFCWLQHQIGVVDEVQWNTEMRVMRSVLSTHRSRVWWDLVGRFVFGAKFVEYVDDALVDQPATNDSWEILTDFTNR